MSVLRGAAFLAKGHGIWYTGPVPGHMQGFPGQKA